jgi:hypothetical protein
MAVTVSSVYPAGTVVTSGGVYSLGSCQTPPKNVCSSCGVEFEPDVEMFPPVACTKEHQAAKKLMDKKDEEKLCPGCFIEHIKSLDKKVLANVIIGMARKMRKMAEDKVKENHWSHPGTTTDRIYIDPNQVISIDTKTYPAKTYIGDPPGGYDTVTY